MTTATSNLSPLEQAILQIVTLNPNYNADQLAQLVVLTNQIGGVSFVSIKGYKSDRSDNTEVADHLINVGASYEYLSKKDAVRLREIAPQLLNISVTDHNYSGYNLNGKSLTQFQSEVKASILTAYAEMTDSNKKTVKGEHGRESNDIELNKILVFNTNTNRLAIRGLKHRKTVKEEGEYKPVASAPKTVAKNILREAAGLRSKDLRRYCIDNLNTVKVSGETLEVQECAE